MAAENDIPNKASRQSHQLQVWFARKRVLVTGAAGFIGARLSERLQQLGAQVLGADLEPPTTASGGAKVLQIDCAEPLQLRTLVKDCELVFSLAGRCGHGHSMSDPLGDMKANAKAPLAVLDACRRWAPKASVIFASTRQVYGKVQELPVNKSRAVSPVDINGVHKIAAENHHRLFWEHHGVRTNVLRLTNTYGPGMRIRGEGRMFLGEWFHRLLRGEALTLYGDGMQLRDLNHVDDVIDAFLLTAMHGDRFPGEIFNLGAKEALSLVDLAAMLARIANSKTPARLQPFPNALAKIQIESYRGDYTKLQRAVGWEPRIELETGLRQTFDALCRNSGAPGERGGGAD